MIGEEKSTRAIGSTIGRRRLPFEGCFCSFRNGENALMTILYLFAGRCRAVIRSRSRIVCIRSKVRIGKAVRIVQ